MKYFLNRFRKLEAAKDSTPEPGGSSEGNQDQPTDKADDKPADESGDKPADKVDDKPADQINKGLVSGLSIEDVKQLIEALNGRPGQIEQVKSRIAEFAKEPEKEPAKPADEPPKNAEPDPRDKVLRSLLIKSAQVPDELLDLMPEDTSKLATYLESDKYKTLASQIRAASTIQKPNGDNSESATKPPKDKTKEQKKAKTFAEVTHDMLSEFDGLL